MSKLDSLLHDFEVFLNQATPGNWGQGQTSHHTIRIEDGYRIAEFKHAVDATFVDFCKNRGADLIAEIKELQHRLQSLEK